MTERKEHCVFVQRTPEEMSTGWKSAGWGRLVQRAGEMTARREEEQEGAGSRASR